MTYNVYYLEYDGNLTVENCANKKLAQEFINSNFVAVDRVEKETKKSVTNVTEQFEIGITAKEAIEVEKEEKIIFSDDEESFENLENEYKVNADLLLNESIELVFNNLRNYFKTRDRFWIKLVWENCKYNINHLKRQISDSDKRIRDYPELKYEPKYNGKLRSTLDFYKKLDKMVMKEVLPLILSERAVKKACEEIKHADIKREGKVLSFDNFQSSLVWWYYAGIIPKSHLDDLQKLVDKCKKEYFDWGMKDEN